MKYTFEKIPNFISNIWTKFIKLFSYWKHEFARFISKEKNNSDNISQNNHNNSYLIDFFQIYIIKNKLLLSLFDNNEAKKNEHFFLNQNNFNEEISLLNTNETIHNNEHRIINIIQVKKNYYTPELIKFINFNIITNPRSDFLLFYHKGIKIKMHLISSNNLKENLYIIFLFDLIELFEGKNQRAIIRLAFPYLYLLRKILYRCRYKMGTNLIPFRY